MNSWNSLQTILSEAAANPLAARLLAVSVELAILAPITWGLMRLFRLRSARVCALLWLLVLAKGLIGLTVGAPFRLYEVPVAPVTQAASSENYNPAFSMIETESAIEEAKRMADESFSGTFRSSTRRASEAPTLNMENSAIVSAIPAPEVKQQQPKKEEKPSTFSFLTARLSRLSWGGGVAAVWLAGALAMLGLTLLDVRKISRLRRNSSEPSGSLRAIFLAEAKRLGVRNPPQLAVTQGLESPALLGLFRPIVLLPSWLLEEENPQRLRWMLAHELTHWKMRDLVGLALQRAALIALWFHPAAWWVARRWEVAMERACDRAMVEAESEARDYAEQLYRLLEELVDRRGKARLRVGLFASRTQVGERIAHLLGDALRAPARLSPLALATLALGALLVLPVGIGWSLLGAEEEQKEKEAESKAFVGVEGKTPKNPLGLNVDIRKRLAQTNSAFLSLRTACASYQIDWDVAPPRLQALTTPIGYISRIPQDPFGAAPIRVDFDPASRDKNIRFGSVGPDGKWDNGAPLITNDPFLKGDLTETYTPKKMASTSIFLTNPQFKVYAIRPKDVLKSVEKTAPLLTLTGQVTDATLNISDADIARILSANEIESNAKKERVAVAQLEKTFEPKPVPNAPVTLRSETESRQVATDSEGNFEFSALLAGDYQLSCAVPTGPPGKKQMTTRAIRFHLEKGNTRAKLEVRPDRITIEGRVTDPEGNPVAGAKLTGRRVAFYDPFRREELLEARQARTKIWDTAISAADGSYVLRGFDPMSGYHTLGYLLQGKSDLLAHAEISVEYPPLTQYKPQVIQVSLLTKETAAQARKLIPVMSQVFQRAGGNEDRYKEKENLSFPSRDGNTIRGADIALKQAPKPKANPALTNEIEKIIKTNKSIKSAKVEIALPSENLLPEDAKNATASVAISLTPDATLTRAQVESIQAFVAGSVQHLQAENVEIFQTSKPKPQTAPQQISNFSAQPSPEQEASLDRILEAHYTNARSIKSMEFDAKESFYRRQKLPPSKKEYAELLKEKIAQVKKQFPRFTDDNALMVATQGVEMSYGEMLFSYQTSAARSGARFRVTREPFDVFQIHPFSKEKKSSNIGSTFVEIWGNRLGLSFRESPRGRQDRLKGEASISDAPPSWGDLFKCGVVEKFYVEPVSLDEFKILIRHRSLRFLREDDAVAVIGNQGIEWTFDKSRDMLISETIQYRHLADGKKYVSKRTVASDFVKISGHWLAQKYLKETFSWDDASQKEFLSDKTEIEYKYTTLNAAVSDGALDYTVPANTQVRGERQRAGRKVKKIKKDSLPYHTKVPIPFSKLETDLSIIETPKTPESSAEAWGARSDNPDKSKWARASKNELERTIRTNKKIKDAKVELTIPPENPSEKDAQNATASVIISLMPDEVLTRGQIVSIQTFVAASVPRLRVEDVEILQSPPKPTPTPKPVVTEALFWATDRLSETPITKSVDSGMDGDYMDAGDPPFEASVVPVPVVPEEWRPLKTPKGGWPTDRRLLGLIPEGKQEIKSILESVIKAQEKSGRNDAMVHYAISNWLAPPEFQPRAYDLALDVLKNGWSEKSNALNAFLAAYQPTFDQIRKGAALDFVHLGEPQKGPTWTITDLLSLQVSARTLAADALRLAALDRHDEAMENLLAILAMGRDCGIAEPRTIGGLMAIAIQGIGLTQINNLIAKENLDRGLLERVLKRLKEIDTSSRSFVDTTRLELLSGDEWVKQVQESSDEMLAAAAKLGELEKAKQFLRDLPQIKKEFQLVSDRITKHAESSWVESNTETFERDMKAIQKKVHPIVANNISSASESKVRFLRAKTWFRRTQIQTALECERLARGAYPERLNALKAPQFFLQGAPEDPFSSAPFRYTRAGDGGFLLWSLGPDSVDDGAKVAYDPTNGTVSRGDILLRMTGRAKK